MARKKKRTNRNKISKQLKLELLGLLLIFLAIFSSGASIISDGFVPTSLANTFRFLFGIWYFVASVILFILGIYLVIKRKFPQFFTKRTLGLMMIFIGMLLFTHIQTFERLLIDVDQTSIIKTTWQHFVAFTKGTGVQSQLGGGMVGAILFAISYFLFSFVGAKIVAVFTIIIGFLFLTNILIGKIYETSKNYLLQVWHKLKTIVVNAQREKEKVKEERMNEQLPSETDKEQQEEREIEEIDVQFAYENASGQMAFPISNESEVDNSDETDDDETLEKELSENLSNQHAEDNHYELPPIELLEEPVVQTQQRDKFKIRHTVEILEKTFASFGVNAKITKAHVGPAVTKYEVYPEAGVKVSKILNLQDDLALALAAQDIRIEAPIPGKSAIGIEVPNSEIATVSLREVLNVKRQLHKKLLFALGKDISGEVVEGELNKMPHLLIAGATGSGKSVCINGIITSILMRAKPNEVKMMMIDPKKVELNVYNGIPHLLTPVVTDPKKASLALRKIVMEMEHRYELFSETGTRNLEGYNNFVQKQNELTGENTPRLPYIVVLVDELADLMMVASNDVEDSITRLAQMARAAGIHLIIATQRPSVDVITGVIKANIPSRIAFSVSSQVDSRTILDMAGAEKLLGRGDMLYIPVGQSKPIRVQGAFLSDEEVQRVVEHCINQQKAVYEEEMNPENMADIDWEETDELFKEAVDFVIEMQTASVSMLQRRFRIGYNRAARLIDAMEERGIVGPYEGNRPREVLIEQDTDKENE